MRKPFGIPGLVLVALLLCHAAAAYGAPSSSPTDPSAGSPAGAEYQLPFEKGRQDAAPKGTGGTSAPGAAGGGGGSPGGGGSTGAGAGQSGEADLYRSENNFGSASKVPGARPGENGVPADGKAAGAGGRGAGGTGSGGSGDGSGGSGTGGGGSGSASALDVGRLTHSGNTSAATNIGLLALIALVAAGVGVLSARAARLRRPRP